MSGEKEGLVLTPRNEKYLLEELKSLRSEILNWQNMDFQLERGALAAILVVYGLIFSDSVQIDEDLEVWIWFIPPIVAAFCLRRKYILTNNIRTIGDHIRQNIEAKFLGPELQGWQS